VYDDGRVNPIVLFQTGDIPITIGLVVDHSQSMMSKLDAVNAAATAFARSGHDGDELFAVGFSSGARVLPLARGALFTKDPGELDAALSGQVAGGRTALYDAVAAALRRLPDGHAERQALVVVTDGDDNASRLKYKDVRDMARRSRAVIYGIGLVGDAFQDEDPENLKRLCRDSGGVAYFPDAHSSVADIFARITRDLREQYTLGFVPGARKPSQLFHDLRVRATDAQGRNRRVRTRSGYNTRPPAA
jgi:Ca-activated chloride channel family protein